MSVHAGSTVLTSHPTDIKYNYGRYWILELKGLALLFFVIGRVSSLNTLDTTRPIVWLSPVRGQEIDEFGFSVAAHRMNASATGFTDTLSSTLIIVGAPLGRYPGGLNLPLNSSICELYDEARNINRDISALTDTEIRECYLRTGLIYSCPLVGSTICGPVLGDMDAYGADGALYDRVGNIKQSNHFGFPTIQQNKSLQRMGNTVFSSGEFFVACAPFWQKNLHNVIRAPAGSCVFSGRSLTTFQYTKPCDPINSNNNKQDEFCLSGTSAAIAEGIQSSDSVLGVSTPGRFSYTGGVYFYNNLSSTEPQTTISHDLELGLTRQHSVRAHVDIFVDLPHTDPINVADNPDSIYGFSVDVGHFNGSDTSELFFVSAPRFMDGVGQVSVVTSLSQIPVISAVGDQIGEYFGYSLTTADLNGDGYDDLVVGAPIYAKPNQPDIGRIVIFYNNKGQGLIKNASIAGQVTFGHFGHSITNLGDLNNDGCDDIAVSAPFDEGGKVFTYFGCNDSSTIINTTRQQVITAEQMVSQVSNLTSLEGFGFSLDGKVDVDGNGYRDLVVSAVGNTSGQAVFVLRSFPVANVVLTITQAPAEINRLVKACVVNGAPITCINITVCGQFSGKGLTSIEPKFEVRENTLIQPRIFFTSPNVGNDSYTGTINMATANQLYCTVFTAYVKNDLLPDQTLTPLSITIMLIQSERPESLEAISTNFQPDDISAYPIIHSSPIETKIPFNITAELLLPPLMPSLTPTTAAIMPSVTPTTTTTQPIIGPVISENGVAFINASGQEQQIFTVGRVSQVIINLRISNISDNTVSGSLIFQLPAAFAYPTLTPRQLFSCRITSNSNHYECSSTRPLQTSNNTIDIKLRLQVSQTAIQGQKESFDIPISFKVTSRTNFDSASSNTITVNIPITVSGQVNIQIPRHFIPYFGNLTMTGITPDFRNITLTYWLRNQGPSPIYNASLKILLPFSVPAQQNRYYLYPYSIMVNPEDSLKCSQEGVINPEHIESSSNMDRPSSSPTTYSGLPTIMNCSSSPELCQELTCQLNNFTSTVAFIGLTVIIDERTLFNIYQNFTLVTKATVVIHNNFIATAGSVLSTYTNIELVKTGSVRRPNPTPTSNDSAPVYAVIVPPVIVGIVLIIITVVIVILFVIFYNRKIK